MNTQTSQTSAQHSDASDIQSVAFWIGLAFKMARTLGDQRDLHLASGDLRYALLATAGIECDETRQRARTLIDAAARILIGYTYYTVLVPYSSKPTEWHPTQSTGPFSVLSRGVFPSERLAHEWAHRLNGEAYSVRAVYDHSALSLPFASE